MEKLVLIDGNSLLNRAFYATPMFTTKDGTPTNAVFGFVKLLLNIIKDLKPEYLIVAFDLKAPTFRHKLYTDYKGNRRGMPDELAVQMPILKDLLRQMNIAICEKEGFEADDIIGTLSKKFDVHSYIYTGDRDSYQLVDKNTDVHFTIKGVSELQKLNYENFKCLVGCNPIQIIDLKSLMGDKSDNIPGVAGVGEKTAKDLIEKYGSLENVYDNIENIKGALKTKLELNKEMAFLSKTLATIKTDVPLDIDLKKCKLENKFSNEVKNKFAQLEFRSLLSLDIFQNQERVEIRTELVRSKENFISLCKSQKELYLVYSNGLFAFIDGIEYKMPIRLNLIDDAFTDEEIIDTLGKVLKDYTGCLITNNSKNLRHILDKNGIKLSCKFEDISILKYIVDYNGKDDDLNYLIEYYGFDENCPAYSVSKIYAILIEKLYTEKQEKLYYDLELPLSICLFEMEKAGFKVDENQLDEIGKKLKKELTILSEKIYELSGQIFNINSPSQLGEILFDKLGLEGGKKGKTGKYSTNVEILENLTNSHPIIEQIIKYRQIQKLLSTYIEGLKPLIDKKTSLIHTSFNQVVTSTGRLSSTNPNLQNIPTRDTEGKEIRKFFVSQDEKHILIDADYSQIELRLLAHFSNCKELVQAYNNDEDIHTLTASQVFETPIEEVTSNMRRSAKAVNFGIIYGISDYGLAKQLKIPTQKAKEYINKYFETYTAVKEYMNSTIEFARQNGYVQTLLGRKRKIPEIKSTNYNIRSFGERAAMNMPLQGSSADIIKIAMLNVSKRLKDENLKSELILQVHDELIIDALEEEADIVEKLLKSEMENAVKLTVPLTASVSRGRCWFDCK